MGSGRVLDEVLVLVLDSALEVTGAERGFIMLAGTDGRTRVHAGPRPGSRHAAGPDIPDQPQDPRGSIRHRPGPRCRRPARHRSGRRPRRHDRARDSTRVVRAARAGPLRRSAGHGWNNRSGSACSIWTDRTRARLLSPTTRAALEALAGEAALVIENARLYREAIENARLEQQMKIAADIQRALLPNPHYIRQRVRAGVRVSAVPGHRRRFLRLRRPAGWRVRVRAGRRLGQRPAGGAADGGGARGVRDRSLARPFPVRRARRAQ